jgi:hypothetical protein
MSVRLTAAREIRGPVVAVPIEAVVTLPASYSSGAQGRSTQRGGFLVTSPWGHKCHWFRPLIPGGVPECVCQLSWYLFTRQPWDPRVASVLEPRQPRG